MKKIILEVGGRHNHDERPNLHYVHCGKKGHEERLVEFHGRRSQKKGAKRRKR